MSTSRSTRRHFLKSSVAASAAGGMLPAWLAEATSARAQRPASANDRLQVGAIGVGGRGTGIARNAAKLGDVVAVCDVDAARVAKAQETFAGQFGRRPDGLSDYRRLLERTDLDVVTIGTPDHWHTKTAIAALKSGRDVYCEKPLTLTVAEGRQLVGVVKETGRVLQVGTQQRSEMKLNFLRAVATVRSGQLGKLEKVTVTLPLSTKTGGPFETQPVPEGLDWNFWLGQAASVPYVPQRCHYTFRWWYEYSGGIMTDWGAHHMDITQWALDAESSGPLSVDGSKTQLPNIPGGYNTPKDVLVDYMYPGGVHVQVAAGREGILFEGDKGRIYTNRGRITGKPIEEQDADKSLADATRAQMAKLYGGALPASTNGHMANFFEAVRRRKQPISDVAGQHRSVSACHIGNISIRLGRKLTWNAATEQFVGDEEANAMLGRDQRSPYQIDV